MNSLLVRFFTWIKQWIQKSPKTPKYELVDLTEHLGEPYTGVKLHIDPYEGLIYFYSKVRVMEHPDQSSATLQFNYYIINPNTKHLAEDQQLHKIAGDILAELLNAGTGEIVTQKDFEHEGDLNESTRTHYFEEPDSQ